TPLQSAYKYKNMGNVYFKTGKYNEAIAQYNKAIDICPKEKVNDLAILYQNRSAANEKLKKYSSVKADCTKALELNPTYMKALLRRARALEQIGDLEAALKDMATVCIHESFSNRTSLVTADKIFNKFVEQLAQEYLANKEYVMLSKNFIESYTKMFSKDPVFSRLQQPENIPEFFKKPLQALKERKYDDVIPLCTEVIKSSEFDTLPSSKFEVLLLRATFYVLLGKQDAAIKDFERVVTSKDASEDVRINALIKRANLYAQLEILELAHKDFDSAISINPKCSDIYHHRGVLQINMHGLLDQAKRDFDKAVECNPNFGAAYVQKLDADFRIALMSENVRSIKAAAKEYKKAFKKFPNPPESTLYYAMYAQVMLESQQFEKADTILAAALEKDSANANLYVLRGSLQLQWKQNVDKAIEYMKKALEIDDKCELAYLGLGQIEMERHVSKEAITLFENVLILCRTYMQLIDMYIMINAVKIQLHVQKQLGCIPRFLQSFTGFIDVEVADRHRLCRIN
ncbi:Mitochondrial import receptor subunit TOM70, partial [Trachymyrmex zeteki]